MYRSALLALVYVSAALAVDPTLTLISRERIVYLVTVRFISIWCCNWLMLFMTLDMPDDSEGTPSR